MPPPRVSNSRIGTCRGCFSGPPGPVALGMKCGRIVVVLCKNHPVTTDSLLVREPYSEADAARLLPLPQATLHY